MSFPRLSAMGSSKEKITEHNLSLRMKSSSRFAGGASRRAGNSFRAVRSAPGSCTWTRSNSWPEDFEEERLVVLVLSVDVPLVGVELLLLLPLLDRDDFECDGGLEDDESSFFSLCFFPIFNLIMICFFGAMLRCLIVTVQQEWVCVTAFEVVDGASPNRVFYSRMAICCLYVAVRIEGPAARDRS
jgi:hypothetical protein